MKKYYRMANICIKKDKTVNPCKVSAATHSALIEWAGETLDGIAINKLCSIILHDACKAWREKKELKAKKN